MKLQTSLIPNMLTCLGKHNLESFAILDGHDRHVILAPDLPTWNDSQPPQYRKSPRLPHRLLRIPDTNPFAVYYLYAIFINILGRIASGSWSSTNKY